MPRTRARLIKATFNLPEDLLRSLDQAVKSGAAASKNAFVERALEQELEAIRRHARAALWEEASRDPLFLRDIEDVEAEFASADAESSRTIG
jgi:hypothetical protein